MSSYIEKIEAVKQEVRDKKRVFDSKKSKSKVYLSEEEIKFAKKTYTLSNDERFKEVLGLLARVRATLLSNPYKKSPLCERDNFEYSIGFNDGFYNGVRFITSELDRMWSFYLTNLENEEGE